MNHKGNRKLYALDLLHYILLHYKEMLVCILLGAVACNYYGTKKAQQSFDSKVAQTTYDDEYFEKNLTIEQKNNVIDYVGYKRVLDSNHEYSRNSVILNLDSSHVPTYTMTFLIKGTSDVQTLTNYIFNYVLDDTFYQDAANQLNFDKEITYLKECVRSGLDKMQTLSGKNNMILNQTIIENVNSQILEIECLMTDLDSATQLGELVEAKIIDALPELKKICEVSYLNSNASTKLNPSLMYEQKIFYDTEHEVLANIKNVKSSFDGKENLYYTYLINDGVLEGPTSKVGSIQPTYLMIGIILGILVIVYIYGFEYIESKKLHVPQDITSYVGASVLGTQRSILKDPVKAMITKLVKRDTPAANEEKFEVILTNLKLLIAQNQFTSIHLTSSVEDAEIERVAAKLIVQLTALGINVTKGKAILQDADSLEAMSQQEAVVFIEKEEKSTIEDIENEIILANEHLINVLGTIIIE